MSKVDQALEVAKNLSMTKRRAIRLLGPNTTCHQIAFCAKHKMRLDTIDGLVQSKIMARDSGILYLTELGVEIYGVIEKVGQ